MYISLHVGDRIEMTVLYLNLYLYLSVHVLTTVRFGKVFCC